MTPEAQSPPQLFKLGTPKIAYPAQPEVAHGNSDKGFSLLAPGQLGYLLVWHGIFALPLGNSNNASAQ